MLHRKIFCLLFVFVASISLWAESSSLWTIGLRGGGNIYMADGDAHAQMGYGGNLDVGYTCYWNTRNAEVGIHTGLTAGCCTNRFTGQINRQFTNYDYLGYKMDYTVYAQKVEQNIIRQIQVEIPLMLAIRTDNMFVNVGAKFMMPLYDQYNQNLSDIIIDAYYERPDVHVANRLITGLAGESNVNFSGEGCLPKYNLLLGVEIGYEWTLTDRSRIGLGIYGDISPWSSYRPATSAYIIEVYPIDDPEYPPAEVSVQPLSSTSVSKLLFCDFGIKFYYGINCINRHSLGLKQ